MVAALNFVVVLCLLAVSGISGKSVDTQSAENGNSDDWMHQFSPKFNSRQSRDYESASHWMNSAQSMLEEKLKEHVIKAEAKNTVFFLGDGMSLPTVTAARIYKGQKHDGLEFGEESSLFFENFPNIGVSKTFCSDSQVADSACSATAYLSGTKANIKTIGVKPSVQVNDCVAQMNPEHQVNSVLAWAQAAGKSTGVVTTTRITHASPAGTYAHIAHRDWENDSVLPAGVDSSTCDDIAKQLILRSPGQNINVILGGGRREFLPNTVRDPVTNANGRRRDGFNLIEKWEQLRAGQNARYVWNRTDFESINATNTDYLFGLFNYDHLSYDLDESDEPTLPELTAKAIEILSKNPKGFFLFVEGGRIDHAHHDTMAQKALQETVIFAKAVETASNMTNINETLILVTSDHAHTMSISGYPTRGNPILGIADVSEKDHLPFTTLSYANGPGYKYPLMTGERFNISNDPLEDKDYKQMTGLPLSSETHGGDDVMIFSQGPFSHLLKGVVQQSFIPHVVGYAQCTGSGIKFCDA